MKQAKRPTLAQKKVIASNRLDWKSVYSIVLPDFTG